MAPDAEPAEPQCTGGGEAPDAATEVLLSFGAAVGQPQAVEHDLVADQQLAALCAAEPLACDHAFEVGAPYSLFDGAAHPVHASGRDTFEGSPAELAQSPGSLACTAELAGVRRPVDDAALTGWAFRTSGIWRRPIPRPSPSCRPARRSGRRRISW